MVRRLVLSAAAAVLAVALSAAPSPSTAASGGISGKPRVESGDQFRWAEHGFSFTVSMRLSSISVARTSMAVLFVAA